MIVRERPDEFILIHQHDHAFISGELCKQWKEEYFLGEKDRESVELAVKEHDWCWQELDNHPLFLKEKGKPASFVDHPLERKIFAYQSGVNHMENVDKYAALLISKHYKSFFKGNVVLMGRIFREEEEFRQKQLIEELAGLDMDNVSFHFDLLQLCDNLSLYICMNEWGSNKEDEISWFREGFPQRLSPLDKVSFYTEWESVHHINMIPFPFKEKRLEVSVPYYRIQKEELVETSLIDILKHCNKEYHRVVFHEGR